MLLAPLFLAMPLMKSYSAPTPQILSGGQFAVSVVPPRREGERIVPCKLRLFTVDDLDKERTLWRGAVGWTPAVAKVSSDGHAVLMGQYPGVGDEHAVTILGDDGRVLADYPVQQLLTPKELEAMPANVWGERKWVGSSWFESIRNVAGAPPVTMPPSVRRVGEAPEIRNEYPLAFVVRTLSGRVLWFDLVTGKVYPSEVPRG